MGPGGYIEQVNFAPTSVLLLRTCLQSRENSVSHVVHQNRVLHDGSVLGVQLGKVPVQIQPATELLSRHGLGFVALVAIYEGMCLPRIVSGSISS